MNQKAFTIHTQLIDGSLEGARNIYMGANRTCHLYVLPRNEVSLANTTEDISGQWAFYILIGPGNKAYIGQTADFASRKNDHIQKNWWHTALVFISDNHKIYGDDVRFLEYLGIKAAMEADSYTLDNTVVPRKPNIAQHQVNDMENFFNDIVLLTNFYGVKIFTSQKAEDSASEVLFYVKAFDRPASGIGFFDGKTGKFILKKGSRLAANTAPKYNNKQPREEFISKYCKNIDGEIILQQDVALDSPSGASKIILGRSSNGKTDWKDSEGRTFGSYIENQSTE